MRRRSFGEKFEWKDARVQDTFPGAPSALSRLLRTVAMTKTCERSVDKKFKMLDMQGSHLDPALKRELHSRIAVNDTDGERHMECSEWFELVGAVLS